MWFIIKYTLYCVALLISLLLINILYTVVLVCRKQKRLQAQGVYFSGTPFQSIKSDVFKVLQVVGDGTNTALDSLALIEAICPGPNKPSFIGVNMFYDIYVYCTDPHMTSQIYIDYNKYHSKPETMRTVMH